MKLAIYCGANEGVNFIYKQEAKKLGEYMAKQGIELVYGGAKIGIMGTIADAVMENGGVAHGIITEFLKDKEIVHRNLSTLSVTKDMHERKKTMIDLADAFVALPGGAGTLDEIFEAWTWMQIGLHEKHCAFYNTNGFYDGLIEFLSRVSNDGFLHEKFVKNLIIENEPKALIEAINTAKNHKTSGNKG